MTVEEMQQRKRELGLTYQDIAKRCGLSVPTVQRIISGSDINSRDYSKAMIETVLEKTPHVMEGEAAYRLGYMSKKQGEYTAYDYYELPDDERCELIDGVIYDHASPAISHQEIAGEIFMAFKSFVKSKKGSCRPMIAPVDVKLDDWTIVQPDVLILCDRSKADGDKRIGGAPDLIAEVISPSTKSKDYILKLNKYLKSGVREYWIVDPQQDKITVYLFGGEWDPDGQFTVKEYSFADKVPVAIWNNECVVDFAEIKEYLWD